MLLTLKVHFFKTYRLMKIVVSQNENEKNQLSQKNIESSKLRDAFFYDLQSIKNIAYCSNEIRFQEVHLCICMCICDHLERKQLWHDICGFGMGRELEKAQMFKFSLYSRCYVEASNEWRGPFPRLCAWETQFRSNIAALANSR